MRICLFTKYGESSNLLYQGTVEALKSLNIPILNLNINQELHLPNPYWITIPTLKPHVSTSNELTLVEKIKNFRPTDIWILSYSSLQFLLNNGDALKEMTHDGNIIYWTGDLAPELKTNTLLGSLIDYVFLNDSQTIDLYKNKWSVNNVYYMPHGTIPSSFYPVNKYQKKEIGFLGRRQTIQNRYDNRNYILDQFKNNTTFIESDSIVELEAMHHFYQECKIALGISWNNKALLYTSDRIYNILGSGCFCLHEYFLGIEKLFQDNKHLRWFTDIKEGLSLAKYYLQHDDEREKIAKDGYLLVKNNHSYCNRIENIFDIIHNKTNIFYGFLKQ